MVVPNPTVQVQGAGAVSGDQLNTYVQACASIAQMRGVTGIGQMLLYLEGFVSPGDGGQGPFVWIATAPGPDDGVNVIVPTGVTVGAWIRISAVGVTIIRAITYVIDGVGSVPATGVRGQLSIPFACTIQSVTLLADQPGNAVVDIWKVPYSAYNLPSAPTVANSICAADLPTLSGASHSQDAGLAGWTTAINANDTLVYNLQSVATITRLTITLKVQ